MSVGRWGTLLWYSASRGVSPCMMSLGSLVIWRKAEGMLKAAMLLEDYQDTQLSALHIRVTQQEGLTLTPEGNTDTQHKSL